MQFSDSYSHYRFFNHFVQNISLLVMECVCNFPIREFSQSVDYAYYFVFCIPVIFHLLSTILVSYPINISLPKFPCLPCPTCISRKQADSDDVFALKTKLAQCTSDLEKAEDKAENGETKIIELKEELRVVTNNLKSLEVSEEQASECEKSYKENIKTLTSKLEQAEARVKSAEKSLEVSEEKANECEKSYNEEIKTLRSKLKQAEARAKSAEKSEQKLQKEVTQIGDFFTVEKEKFIDASEIIIKHFDNKIRIQA